MKNKIKDDDLDLYYLNKIKNIPWWEWVVIWVVLTATIIWCCFQCRPDSFLCNLVSWVYRFMYDLARWFGLM